jgi:carbon-monoxide dehydrogenase medium subunit
MVIDKVGHSRCVTMSEFAIGFMSTTLAAGELLSAVRLTPWPSAHGYGFHEFARRKGDWAVVSVGVLMTLDVAGKIDRVAIALGGIASTPLRRPLAEAQLLGAAPKLERLDAAAAMVDDIEVLDDVNAPAWYRRQLARVLTRRALVDAARLAGAPL